MKQLWKVLCAVLLVTALAACSNDDDSEGKVTLDPKALFLDWGESGTISFSGVNIKSFALGSYPEGWPKPEINTVTQTLTVTAPEKGAEVASTGTVRVNGATKGGEVIGASLYVSIGSEEFDYTQQPANCYMAGKANAHYLLSATKRPDGSVGVAPASVAVVWQTSSNLIQYLDMEGDVISFYIGSDSDDATKIKSGNALIGGYDAAGELVWSWHVWASDYDAEASAVELGDYTLMARHLGALANTAETIEDHLKSYGLYYQWGRKEPFVGPERYTAEQGETAPLYNGNLEYVYLSMVASDSETGNYDYATKHPMHFLTTSSKSEPWNKQTATVAEGWNTSDKSVNDPCPYGWRVAPASAFDALTIADDLTAEGSDYTDQFGWTLTDGTHASFFFAAGRRTYLDGKIQNLYDESLSRNAATEAQPWVGYNWTADGAAFAFWFNKADVTTSGLRADLQMSTANGMSVRCVREK